MPVTPTGAKAQFDFSKDSQRGDASWKDGEGTSQKSGKPFAWSRRGVFIGGKIQAGVVTNVMTSPTKKGDTRTHMTIVIEKWTDGANKEQVKSFADHIVKVIEDLAGEKGAPYGKLFNVSSVELPAKGTKIDDVKE